MAAPYILIHYRWINDDGNANNGTFAANQDTALTRKSNLNTRLRVSLDSGLFNGAVKIQYSKDGGAYADLPTAFSSAGVILQDSVLYTNQTATSQRLTGGLGGHTFKAGYAMDTSITTPSLALSNQFTEIEYCLIFTHLARGHTYTFKIIPSGGGAPTMNYTPTITITSDGGFFKAV